MTEVESRPQQVGPESGVRCPKCAASPQLAQSFLDPRTGKTARFFSCACGERIWRECSESDAQGLLSISSVVSPAQNAL